MLSSPDYVCVQPEQILGSSLADTGASSGGCLSFRARKQGACRELKGPAALVSPLSCQRTSKSERLRKGMKTRQEKMEEDKTRREETHHKEERTKGSETDGRECQEQGDGIEAGGNGESKRVWTKRVEIHSSNFELIKGLRRLRHDSIFKGTERERDREGEEGGKLRVGKI